MRARRRAQQRANPVGRLLMEAQERAGRACGRAQDKLWHKLKIGFRQKQGCSSRHSFPNRGRFIRERQSEFVALSLGAGPVRTSQLCQHRTAGGSKSVRSATRG